MLITAILLLYLQYYLKPRIGAKDLKFKLSREKINPYRQRNCVE